MSAAASSAAGGSRDASSSPPSSLKSALSSWSAFSLTDRRPHLDSSAQGLLDARESSVKARKQLAESTKSLKRAVRSAEQEASSGSPGGEAVATLAGECKSTIKQYQEEIDALTRRCKSAESSFVQLYHALCECPDPAPVLEECARLIEGRDGQVANLLRAVEEVNSELEACRDEKERLESDLEERDGELKEALVSKKQRSCTKSAGCTGSNSSSRNTHFTRTSSA